jgi:hypothetical protein
MGGDDSTADPQPNLRSRSTALTFSGHGGSWGDLIMAAVFQNERLFRKAWGGIFHGTPLSPDAHWLVLVDRT